jgi:hypothetical protein
MGKPAFLNFQVDHMTLLLQPKFYNVAYVLFRNVLGVTPDDILYDKRKEWKKGQGEQSMTFAVRVGQGGHEPKELLNTIIAVVQPSEPLDQSSHVREMLDGHRAAAHWQHIALRTSDLLAFHEHALKRGVRFITPILKDDQEDLIQVFSGEWFFSGMPSSGMFFEFLQRNPSSDQMTRLQSHNSEAWFRDRTFLGLYQEKENEYQSGNVKPFVDFELFEMLHERVGKLKTWEIDDKMLKTCDQLMLDYASKHQ